MSDDHETPATDSNPPPWPPRRLAPWHERAAQGLAPTESPMTNDPLHPVPTERRVLVTALDQQLITVPLETLLRGRGLDPALPYRTETAPDDATLYIQAIPPPEAPA